MDKNKVPAHVRKDIIDYYESNRVYSTEDRSPEIDTDAFIESHTPQEVFHRYLFWNGIQGWAHTLWDVVLELNS